MKKLLFFLVSFLSTLLVSAQDINKIFPPDGFGLSDQEMRAHYFDSDTNTIFCSTKIYNNTENRFENHIVLYDATNESIQLIDSFFATSNVDFVNFNNFKRYNDLLFFAFGKKVWQYDFNTQTFDLVLDVVNLDGFDIVGDFLIYYTPGLARFRSLLSNEVVTTYNAAYLDAFHVEGEDIYFYESNFGSSSVKVYQLVKYNISSNSFETLFSASFSTSFSIVRRSNFVNLGDHLIYTINTSSGTASYVSLNMTNNTVNSNFTFSVPTQFQLNKPFLINNQVYVTTVEDTYVSNGINQPTLTSLGSFDGSEIIAPNPIYNNEIYRVVNRDNLGSEIWKTDGQTISLLKDIITGAEGGMNSFSIGYEYNGKIYFANAQDVIYVSNGTEEGTLPLYDADLFTFVSVPLIHDNTDGIYFFGESPSLGNGLFKLAYDGLSVDEFNSDSTIVEFYPNPAINTINFSKVVQNVKVFDMQGKLLLTANNIEQMDVSRLSTSSIYIIEYAHNNKVYNKKLLFTSRQ